ncbi:hypothetical protein RCL_jg15443.t1 [Rhizophagus clarus]|uniref:Uncharacterized protein n=1 Tax=Rhizophagus clarus TaxID=94130 RepID=A0A8H3Q9W7_9GLOM|nr:hypothetical protein RCL_jg15443.t1 [Rhizophagus clarus]
MVRRGSVLVRKTVFGLFIVPRTTVTRYKASRTGRSWSQAGPVHSAFPRKIKENQNAINLAQLSCYS